jgi:predicted permease
MCPVTILQDVRYAVRVLLATPLTTLTMLLILGVGIGANTAIFSFVNALFLKPPALEHPAELVKVFAKGPSGHYGAGFSYPEFASLRADATSLSALAAETQIAQTHVLFADDAREMRSAFVSENYFSVLGIHPLLGRFFLPEEDSVPDRDAVAVIGAEMWLNQFHADPNVIGSTISINQAPFRIVGVAPRGFQGVHAGYPQQLWMPLMMLHAARFFGGCPHAYDCSIIDDLVGRLGQGRSGSEAQDELSRIVDWSASDWPPSQGKRQVAVFSAIGLDPDVRADYATQMRLMMGVAAVLLLVSCANLAGLFLARSLARGKEIGVRLALGASRARVMRQLMTESLLLSLASCVVGVAFSLWGRSALASFYNVDSEGFRHVFDLRLDWRVLAFSFAVALLTGLLFGLVPAARATRQNLIVQLKEGAGAAGSHSGGWLRQGLVTSQIALSLALLVSAGLLVRSSQALSRGTNFNPDHVAVLRVRTELLNYTAKQNEEFFQRIVERMKTLPGVQDVTWVRGGEGLIWAKHGRPVNVSLPGRESQPLGVIHQDIGLDFFSTLKIPLLAGRDFNEHDGPNGPPVAILNQPLAERLWPTESAIGRTLVVNQQRLQVVGVAADIQPANSTEPPSPHLYLPFWQSNPGKEGDLRLAVRVVVDPVAILPEMRRTVREIDPNIPVGEDMSMVKQIEAEYMPVMLSRSVMSYCGMIALCLSAIGLFSVLTYFVRTRTREIGIRLALGAQIENVLRLVIGQGLKMGIAGVAAGVLLSLAATRLLAAWLYGTRSLDIATFVAAAGLLLAVAVAASYLPARVATKVDPIVALRQE